VVVRQNAWKSGKRTGQVFLAAPETAAHGRYETTRPEASTIRLCEIYDHNILWVTRVDNGEKKCPKVYGGAMTPAKG